MLWRFSLSLALIGFFITFYGCPGTIPSDVIKRDASRKNEDAQTITNTPDIGPYGGDRTLFLGDSTSGAGDSNVVGNSDASFSGDQGAAKNDITLQVQVTSANDTCATPATIDLSSLAQGVDLTLQLDFTGSKDDYHFSYCNGWPDLVVKFVNSPGEVNLSCTGGSEWAFVKGQPPADCPSTTYAWALNGSCHPTLGGHVPIPSASYFFFCRKPEGGGPITVTLRRWN